MFRRLFPTLAEWPPEKWLGLPIGIMFVMGAVGGIAVLIFGDWPS